MKVSLFVRHLSAALFAGMLLVFSAGSYAASTPTDKAPGTAETLELENQAILLDEFFDDIDSITDLPMENREGSPVTPGRVAVCHKGVTIMVSQATVAAHLAHGDTLGVCPPSSTIYTVVCLKDKLLVVPLGEVAGYLRRGGTLGSCSGSEVVIMCNGKENVAVQQADVAQRQKEGFKLGPCAGSEAVVMCLNGRTIAVRKEYLDSYIKDGATAGRCPQK